MKLQSAIILFFAFIIFTSCNKDSTVIDSGGAEKDIIISDNVVQFDDGDFSYFVRSFSEDSTLITFDSAVKDKYTLEARRIILSLDGNGFIAEIKEVTDNNSTLTAEVQPASVCEAIVKGSAEFSNEPVNLSGLQFIPSNNVRLLSLNDGGNNPSGGNKSEAELLLSVLIYDKDGDPQTEDDQIKTDLRLIFSPVFSGKIVIEKSTVKEMRLSFEANEIFDVSVAALSDGWTEDLDYSWYDVYIGKVIFPSFKLGDLPIKISPSLNIFTFGNLLLTGKMDCNVSQNNSYTLILNYLDSDEWATYENHLSSYNYTTPVVSKDADVDIIFPKKFFYDVYQNKSFLFTSSSGVSISSDSAGTPEWLLIGSLSGSATLTMNSWEESLNDSVRNLFLDTEIIARSHGGENFPPAKPHDPIPPDGIFNQLYELTLNWQCEDPDNDPLTYDVYFGLSENPPLVASSISENSYDPGPLTPDQIYYWKITADDNHGHIVEGDVWMFSTIHARSPALIDNRKF